MKFAVLCLLLVGTGISFARSPPAVPKPTCVPPHTYLQPNTVSSYDYSVVTEAGAIRRSGTSAGNRYRCKLTVESANRCSYTLRVTSCTISEKDPTKEGTTEEKQHPDSAAFSDSMRKYPLDFHLDNGVVSDVLAHENEPLPILNIKRGIISALTTKKDVTDGEPEETTRIDVQGACHVTYKKVGPNTVRMDKDYNECQFPSKLDWHYSPFSLLWNSSFIQPLLIDSHAECLYQFSNDGLKKSTCTERHGIKSPASHGDDKISIRALVTHTLTLTGVEKRAPSTEHSAQLKAKKNIPYEYERTPVPTTPSAEILPKAKEIFDEMVEETYDEVKPGVGRHFMDFVKVLRKAGDFDALKQLAKPCDNANTKLPCSPDNKEVLNKIATKLYTSAVAHCNSVPCIREIRRMTADKEIDEVYLARILHAWSRIKITDLEVFSQFGAICEQTKSRTCYLALSAAVHRFWERKHDLPQAVPASVQKFLEEVHQKIGESCEKDESEELIGLKAFGNLGDIGRKEIKDIEAVVNRCVHSASTTWKVKVAAIQSLRRLSPSDALYTTLLDIVKDTTVELEVRVWAYKILVNTFRNAKTVQAIREYLETHPDQHKDDEYQVRKYIVSNLRETLVDRRSPAVIEFAKLIREEFARTDELTEGEKTSEIRKLGDSGVLEESAFHKVSFLDDAVNQFGIRFLLDNLYDGKAFVPFASIANISLQVFGRNVNFLEIVSSYRNQARTIAALADHFALDEDELDIAELTKASLKNAREIAKYNVDSNAPMKFNYQVEDSLAQNLERIRKAFPISFDPQKVSDFLISYRIFGDEMGFTTPEFLEKTSKSLGARMRAHAGKPVHYVGAVSPFEAYHFVPTMAGLPLVWNTKIVLVHSVKLALGNPAEKRFELDVDYSASIEEKSQMTIHVPGYARAGIETYSTASSSFDTGLVAQSENNVYRLAIKAPTRQVKILRLSRKSSAYSRTVVVPLEDQKLKDSTTSWCSQEVEKAFGVKVCHQSTHAKLGGGNHDQWALMSRSANWELTADFVDKSVKEFGIDVNVLRKDPISSTTIDVASFGKTTDKIITLRAEQNKDKKTSDLTLAIPKLAIRLHANTHPNGENGENCVVDASFFGRDWKLEHMSSQRSEVQLEQDMPNRVIANKRQENVDVHTDLFVLRTPNNLYHWNRTKTSFVYADIINHMITLNPSKAGGEVNSVLPSSFWESPSEAWVQLHLHRSIQPDEPEHVEAFIKTPHFKIETLFLDHTDEVDEHEISYLNTTYVSLPDNKLQSFFNITYAGENVDSEEDGTHNCNHRLSILLPRVTWSAEAKGYKQERKDMKGSISVVIERVKITPKDSQYEDEIEYWLPENADHFERDSQSLVLRANVEKLKKPANEYQASFLLSIPGYETITAEANAKHEDKGLGFNIDSTYSVSNPNINLLWKTTEKVAYTREGQDPAFQGTYNHRSVLSLINNPGKNWAVYTLDGTLDDKALRVVENLDSTFYVYNSTFNWKYSAPEYSDLTLDIVADSPIWDFLKFKMNQVVHQKGGKMSMSDSLMDVSSVAEWKDGYHKTIQVVSKNADLVPNAIIEIDFRGIANWISVSFPDINLRLFAIPTMTSDRREIQLTICRNRPCKDIDRDQDAFISQYTYTLDDPTHLAVTVTRDADNARYVRRLIGRRLHNWAEASVQPFINDDHPLNKILEPLLGTSTISEWYSAQMISAVMTSKSVAENAVEALATLQPFLIPLMETGEKVSSKYAYLIEDDDDDDDNDEDLELDSHVSHFITWMYYDEDDLTRAYVRLARDIEPKELAMRPGPYPGRSHIAIYHMPIYLPRFTSMPRVNKAYFLDTHDHDDDNEDDEDDDDDDSLLDAILGTDDEEEKESLDHPPYQFTFHSNRYNRYALIWGVGHGLTFDGGHVEIPSPIGNQCSHLLVHNRVDGRVTVARDTSTLLFLFPSLKFQLLHNGMVIVNDSKTATDLPLESGDGNVTVSRQGDIVEVHTDYHFNVKCSLDHDYCVFATDDFTHGNLVGVLGNNNRIKSQMSSEKGRPSPVDTTIQFQLSPDSTCDYNRPNQCRRLGENESSKGDICMGGAERRDYAYQYQVEKCLELISWNKFFDDCLQDQHCQGNGCASQHAYRALCGAHDIPLDFPTSCTKCVNGLQINDEKEYTIEPEVQVIVLVDRSQNIPSATLTENLVALASQIDKAFKEDNFKSVEFGLLVFRSHGDTEDAEQYSINGKLTANVEDFVKQAINRIDVEPIENDEEPCVDAIVDALDAKERYYPTRPEQLQVVLIVADEDATKHVDMDAVRSALDNLDDTHVYGVAHFDGMKKKLMEQSDARESLANSPNGLIARLAFETDGAILKNKDLSPANALALAKTMASRAKEQVGKCHNCRCNEPTVYTPQIRCSKTFTCGEN